MHWIFRNIRSGNFLYNRWLAATLWFGLSFIIVLLTVRAGRLNNFEVFRHVFFHVIQKVNLYVEYPSQYADVNLYGPVFSLVIAPFALLPLKFGAACWAMCNATFLYYAIYRLPINKKWKTALVVLCAHEMMHSNAFLQSNALICGCILLAFVYTVQKKEPYALFFIMLPAFIKIYGIVALVFIFFSSKPLRFMAWAAIWFLIFFFLPLVITDFNFLLQCYNDWYVGLTIKAGKNIAPGNFFQNISVMGLISRMLSLRINDTVVLALGGLALASQFVYRRYHHHPVYRLYILASLLLFTIIFSSGSESPTYIIALPGICIWYFLQPFSKKLLWFFILAIVLTTFGNSDVFTPWVRVHVVRRYALKALPASIIWGIIFIQIHKHQFLKARSIN
ncbi:MAG: glycosyltransferase family 87 protein [Agriterribacter sp.]